MCDFVDMSTSPPTNYYCEHTICIKDDDGKISYHGKQLNVTMCLT